MTEGYKTLPEAIEIQECKKKRPLSTFEFGFMCGCEYAYEHQQAKVEELQKRVDAALLEIKGAARWIDEDAIDDPDFIKGGALMALKRLVQALKGEGNV